MKNKFLKRRRVDLALDAILEYPLTIISATVGYGKTTAVKEWIKTKNVQYVFFSLSEDDLPESISWNRFALAWEKTFGEQYSLKELNGFPHDIQQVSEFVDVLITAANHKPTIIVCDDYHHVDANPSIRKLVEHLTQEEIPNLHIVLLSRHLTQLNSSLLSSKGLCYIISTDVLAFTQEETIEYLELNGAKSISPEMLTRISHFAEGWPAALVLTQLSIKSNSSVPVLDMDYLMYECFSNLFDSDSRDLLAKLSFLEEFSIAQAIYILENRDIVQILDVALGQNAFIYFDYKTGNYRLHALARIFLLKTVQNRSIDLTKAKYLNGVWLLENGNVYESIKYYLETGHALELIQKLDELDLGYLCHLNTELFQKLCLSLPLDTCKKYPIPYLHMVLNFILSGNQNLALLAKKIMNILEQHFNDPSNEQASFVMGEMEIVKSALDFSDVYKIIEHTTKAILFFEGRSSRIANRSEHTSIGIPVYTYMYFKKLGDLAHLINFHRTEFAPILSTYNVMYGVDQLLLAEHALELGDLENANMHAQLAACISRNKKSFNVYICASFVLMRHDMATNNLQKALERIGELRKLLQDHRSSMPSEANATYNTAITLCDAYINATIGKIQFIPDWIKAGDLSSGSFKHNGMGFVNIIRSKILIQEERWLEMESLAPILRAPYEEHKNQLGLLHHELYLAIARYNLYGPEVAGAEILQLIENTEQDQLVLFIAENAKHLLPILRQMSHIGLSSDYFNKLLSMSKQYDDILRSISPETYQSTGISFTDREREVLALLKQGLMGKEIADKLCLSLIAVKKHLGNIYKKLGVTHKGAAIKKLHELKII